MKKTRVSKKIVIGTKNRDKRRELESLLKRSGIRVLTLADFPGCREAAETGRTFEANARIKSRVYSRHTRSLVLSDDSGLLVRALNGRPGVYSARFAGPGCSYEDNNRKVLRLLSRKRSRRAKFVCAMALYDNGRFVAAVKGQCGGSIAGAPRGARGFGYDPVFVPNGLKKTFAELAPPEKNRISHRGKALRKAKKEILRYFRRKKA